MNGRRCRALLAPHPAVLVEHFIDPMDYRVRQIVVVPSVVAVDHNLHRADRSGIVYNGGCSCPRYRKLSRANLGQVQPGKGSADRRRQFSHRSDQRLTALSDALRHQRHEVRHILIRIGKRAFLRDGEADDIADGICQIVGSIAIGQVFGGLVIGKRGGKDE